MNNFCDELRQDGLDFEWLGKYEFADSEQLFPGYWVVSLKEVSEEFCPLDSKWRKLIVSVFHSELRKIVRSCKRLFHLRYFFYEFVEHV